MSQIQEVFGQFAVSLDNGPVLFKTEAEAAAALSEYENGAEQRELAANFCAHMASVAANPAKAAPFLGKAATGKSNVIVSYLAWVDAGQPGVASADDAEEADVDTGEF